MWKTTSYPHPNGGLSRQNPTMARRTRNYEGPGRGLARVGQPTTPPDAGLRLSVFTGGTQ